MQISTKFTIAIHILAAVDYFGRDTKVTSDLLASSIGSNPVIIRNIMSDLSAAGIIETRRGPGGIVIRKPLDEISFYDVYKAVEKNNDRLFNFHDNPNPDCPVGRNIHTALDGKLAEAQKDFEDVLKKYRLSEVVEDIRKEVEKQDAVS
ncbi:MAG: Rrf2 family transcriptional regulator [Candidatus Weimeria sp.]